MASHHGCAQPREISITTRARVHVSTRASIAHREMTDHAPLVASPDVTSNDSETDAGPPEPREVPNYDHVYEKRRDKLAAACEDDVICLKVLRKYIGLKRVPNLVEYDKHVKNELFDNYEYECAVALMESQMEHVIDVCAELFVKFGPKTPLDEIEKNPAFAFTVGYLRSYGQETASAMTKMMRMRRNALKKIQKRTAEETADDAPPAKKAKTTPSASPSVAPAPAAAPEAPAPEPVLDVTAMKADMANLTGPEMMEKYGCAAMHQLITTQASLCA